MRNENLLLCLLVTFILHVNGHILSGSNLSVKKSRFQSLALKPFGTKLQINDIQADPYCQPIVAYYIGTLQNKKSNKTHDVQFQVKLWADSNKKKIHVYADKWNEEYSESSDFELDFYYDEKREWCDIYDDECVSPFAKKETSFKLDLNTANGNYFHLLSFNYFNNTFGLTNSIGKCTKHQLDGINDNYTPQSLFDKFSFCVCCGDYKPNKLLGCPCDEWNSKPIIVTTQKPTPQKPTPPPTADITCKSIVGYYNGLFQNSDHPNINSQVEFQVRLSANDDTKLITFTVDKWNEQRSRIKNFQLAVWNGEAHIVCSPINKTCTTPYVPKQLTRDFDVSFDHYSYGDYDNIFSFFSVYQFFNTFVLNNAAGQCTKNQYQAPSLAPNTTLYDYCVCCGNEYNPDEVLNCPVNQWATKTNTF